MVSEFILTRFLDLLNHLLSSRYQTTLLLDNYQAMAILLLGHF